MSDKKFYSVEILNTFIEYLRHELHWDQERIQELLLKSSIDSAFLADKNNRFDQKIADQFMKNCTDATQNHDIAYSVGKYTMSPKNLGIAANIFKGFISPLSGFLHVSKFGRMYSTGAKLVAEKINANSIEIKCYIEDDCEEKLYQCRNRQGIIESAAELMGQGARISHPKCYHRGDACCLYTIEWISTSRQQLAKFAFHSLALLSLGTSSFILARTAHASYAWPMLICFLYAVQALVSHLFTLRRTLVEQRRSLEVSITEADQKKDIAELIVNVIKKTTEDKDLHSINRAVLKEIKQKMNYDRSMVLIVNNEKATLDVSETTGFSGPMEKFVRDIKFNINTKNDNGFLIQVVKSKKSVFIRNAQTQSEKLSERSQELLKALKTQAFIAVPVFHEHKIYGVLAVENIEVGKWLSDVDLEILESLANHLSVVYANFESFNALQMSLQKTMELELKERQQREWLERYVPSNIASRNSESHLYEQPSEVKVLSVMFIDIVGFTSLTEKLSAVQVVGMLDVYIEHINNLVIEFDGIINKVIGDGLLVYFDSPEKSMQAAKKILETVPVMNQILTDKNLRTIEIGIGMQVGACILGNIGYGKRMDFTIIGDTVNTAARIEAMTRKYSANSLCFSEDLLRWAHIFPTVLPLGKIKLRGKESENVIYAASVEIHDKIAI